MTSERAAALLALADRVEAASGPDRNTDAEIAQLQGLRVVEEGHPLGPSRISDTTIRVARDHMMQFARSDTRPPAPEYAATVERVARLEALDVAARADSARTL